MSIDIDWSLLSSDATSSLSDNLVSALNTQLNEAKRPSFLGPITVTSFDFGEVGPDVEIKDIRDVWRAFDEGDDEGDAILEAMEHERLQDELASLHLQHSTPPPASTYAPSYSHYSHYSHTPLRRPTRGRHTSAPSLPHGARLPGLQGLVPGSTSVSHAASLADDPGELIDDANSVHSMHSGFHSGRNSVASVGLGVHVLRRGRHPLVPSTPPRASPVPRVALRLPDSAAAALSPPPSPPARPAGLQSERADPFPSAQIHLRLDHASNMSLTLNTSLQVNYPSALFMALPLKLVVTGLTLAADLVFAYSGQKHRLHITIVDGGEDPPTPGAHGHGLAPSGPQAVGQRILPNLHIESEIGSADAHVLRNVGKVERFIVDVVRKTLVEELVFPNFQTIAL